MKRDEEAVLAIQDTVQTMIDPFCADVPDNLVSLSSGANASEEVKLDVAQAHDLGEEQLNEILQNRLISQNTDLFAVVRNFKLKTFASPPKKKAGQTKTVKSDRSVFARLLVVAKERDIDLRKILCYSISPVAQCLSSSDGEALCKTNKAALLHHLESIGGADCVVDKTEMANCALVVDAMALIQSIPSGKLPCTFGQLAEAVLIKLVSLGSMFSADRIDFVGDRYLDCSIKNAERKRRVADVQTITLYGPDQKIPHLWKKYLSSGTNKENLQNFLVKHWEQTTYNVCANLYVGIGDSCKQLKFTVGCRPSVERIVELDSDHEEADTRLILHAAHCCRTYEKAIIWSPDTDVAVIGISHTESMNAYFATGRGKNQRLIHLNRIADAIGPEIARNLTAIHAFTGCDSTSSFYGKGKKSTYNVIKKENISDSFGQIGLSFDFSSSALPALQETVCKIYSTTCKNVADARYKLFCTSAATEQSLPPSEDALTQHLKRVSYQTKIWRSALVPKIAPPSPAGHGWAIIDGLLKVKWLFGSPAPPELLKLSKCNCEKSGCTGAMCACWEVSLYCPLWMPKLWQC